MADMDPTIPTARICAMGEPLGIITVCQGPPRCDLVDDDAVAAAEGGCPFCKRITIHEDGSETVVEPAEA